MRAYECVRCRARYTVEHVNDWGRHADSDGLGPRAVCTALVETVGAVPTARGEIPRHVCKGDLAIAEVPEAEAASVVPARPIGK